MSNQRKFLGSGVKLSLGCSSLPVIFLILAPIIATILPSGPSPDAAKAAIESNNYSNVQNVERHFWGSYFV